MKLQEKAATGKLNGLLPKDFSNLKNYLATLESRQEIMECLDRYSGSFAGWLKIINENVLPEIERKQRLGIPCPEAAEMLENISFFFAKMSYASHELADWNSELAGAKENLSNILRQKQETKRRE